MRAKPIKRDERTLDESSIAALARVASESHEVVERDLRAEIATLKAQTLRHQAAIDAVAQGICFFDGEDRLILSNRRFAEIFRLAPEQIRPGATLREILDLRIAAGTWAADAGDYLSFCVSNHSDKEAIVWTTELRDGRLIQMRRQPMPGGGCVVTYEDVTELKAERAAADERLSLQTLIDRLPDNLWVKDVKSRFVIANQATATRIGLPGPADLIGKTDLELLPPGLAQKFFADEQEIVRTGQPMIDMEEFAWGLKQRISTTKVPLRNDRGEIFGVAGVSRDITERKLADALRDGQAQVLEMIATSAPLENVLNRLVRLVESQLTGIFGAVLLVDETGSRLRVGAAPSLAQAYVKALDGAPIGPKAGPCGIATYRREAVIVADIMTDPLGADYKDVATANGLRSCWSMPILSHDGAVLGVFAMYSKEAREPSPAEMRLVDVATHMAGIAIERKLAEDRIRFMANHDALTGLPNRTLFNDRLSQALLYAQRYDRWVTVAFVDLDNFKIVNDSLGHNAGDELLKIVARRMVACVRATDPVVRLGGDEFVILLLDQPKSADMISATVQKISAAIAEPICLEGHDLRVTSSMGIATYPNDGTDADTLLANADAAMYRAKEMGRDNFQFYTPE
ncbi:MAG: diguanylate cyclase [Roseiarcus sp.]